MTMFLDLRVQSVGGGLAASPNFFGGTSLDDYATIRRDEILQAIRGRNVLVATHGFNVDRASAIRCLSDWGDLLNLPEQDAFLGLIWPGDSVWAHGLDYPDEPKIADEAGELLGPFLDVLMANSASVSLASHSLGARVILQTVSNMATRPRKLIIMAGAIDDDCLTNEFSAAVQNVGEISVLASPRDIVLEASFPLGNVLAGIVDQGHPWWRAALGRSGPARPWPAHFRAPFEIPSNWGYGHHHYLQVDPAAAQGISAPIDVPPDGAGLPSQGAEGWQEAWSSAFAATRFKG
jgi:hypothetical protein